MSVSTSVHFARFLIFETFFPAHFKFNYFVFPEMWRERKVILNNSLHVLEKKIDREKLPTLAAFYQESSALSWLVMLGIIGKCWGQMSREHPLVPPYREENIPPSFLQSVIWPEGIYLFFSWTVKFKVTDILSGKNFCCVTMTCGI